MQNIINANPPKFSAVIPTKDRPDECLNCVKSMLEQTLPFWEIIIVEAVIDKDNMSSLAKALSEIPSTNTHIIYLATDKPGSVHQRNLGIAQVTGDFIFFADDDIVLEKDCLEQICKAFSELDHKVGGVQPLILQENAISHVSSLLRKMFLLSDSTNNNPHMKPSGFPSLASLPDKPVRTNVFSGCCCCYRRSIFPNYLFDERLKGYGAMEDIDLSYRISQSFDLWVWPDAKIHHYPSKRGRIPPEKFYEMTMAHYWYLFNKNMPKIFLYQMAFTWANIGMLFMALGNSLRLKNIAPLRGTIKGLYLGMRGLLP
jgi:GT2 family glycosyltransferase